MTSDNKQIALSKVTINFWITKFNGLFIVLCLSAISDSLDYLSFSLLVTHAPMSHITLGSVPSMSLRSVFSCPASIATMLVEFIIFHFSSPDHLIIELSTESKKCRVGNYINQIRIQLHSIPGGQLFHPLPGMMESKRIKSQKNLEWFPNSISY